MFTRTLDLVAKAGKQNQMKNLNGPILEPQHNKHASQLLILQSEKKLKF